MESWVKNVQELYFFLTHLKSKIIPKQKVCAYKIFMVEQQSYTLKKKKKDIKQKVENYFNHVKEKWKT